MLDEFEPLHEDAFQLFLEGDQIFTVAVMFVFFCSLWTANKKPSSIIRIKVREPPELRHGETCVAVVERICDPEDE